MTPPATKGPILFFDGICNLCNSAVQFIIRHDPEGKIRFAPLQSSAGELAKKAVMAKLGYLPDSLIFLENGVYYAQSDAALKAAGYLAGGWQILYFFLWLPRAIRNPVYKHIAANRYRWFGRQQSCMIPTPGLRNRFINEASGL